MNEPSRAKDRRRGATASAARAIASLLVDAAIVLVAWTGTLVIENTALGFLWRDQFSGIWEIALARHVVVPLGVVMLVPAAVVVAGGWQVATAAKNGSTGASRILAATFATAAGAVGYGVSDGRHFATVVVRAAFVVLLGVIGWFFGERVPARVAAWVKHPALLGLLGIAVAGSSWFADDYVLPRLYPAFHVALFLTTLLGSSLVAFAARADVLSPRPLANSAAVVMAAYVVYYGFTLGRAEDALGRAANLRIVLVEHAPLLGAVVALTTRLRPAVAEADVGPAAPTGPGEVVRALEWTGHDLVLLTVDALRADHVSAYGYPRETTPNIDALAREGTLFESAYCPTPHTSYSVTSMMTGKYLRPLLTLGLGEDSETWAQYARQYGWRTAAFYPPAVFFIDASRFTHFEEEHLGFEYAKVEFADPALREDQVREYLHSAPADRPFFMWVHFFEPHEPYVMHPDHLFSDGPSHDIDAYDSEVATADDGIGRITRLVRASRPGAVVIVTADHGEEFGDHGGRYHGTTVYEEQVRVPLVVTGKGVRGGARVGTVVQTIDILPTALSALGIPRPARLRGRDLGPLLSAAPHDDDKGFAFAETDDYALAASGGDRLVCERRAAACALYDPRSDPGEHHDISAAEGPRATALRSLLRATERDHGRYESAGRSAWPEALRRGLQGETEAALDVASLLDDSDVVIRRKAVEVCFALHVPLAAPAVKRALDRDEDEEVRRWSALALVRMGEPIPALAENLLHDARRDVRRNASLAFAERGDSRGCDEIAGWWGEVAPPSEDDAADADPPQIALDLAHSEELLRATAAGHCRGSVPALLRSLADVRARPYVADTLGALGDERARARLLSFLADEPYVTTRPHEARALLALGTHDWSGDPNPAPAMSVTALPNRTRIVVLITDPKATVTVSAAGAPAAPRETEGEVRTFDLPAAPGSRPARNLRLAVNASSGGITALWLAAPTLSATLDTPQPGPSRGADAADLIDRP